MSAQRKRVLVIHWDDDELISLEQLLEDHGFETTTTWDLQEGMELLRSRHYDLVLVADHEPEFDAGDVLRALQSRVPCVVLRNDARSDPEYFFALGANKVLFSWEREKLTKFLRLALEEKTAASSMARVAAD